MKISLCRASGLLALFFPSFAAAQQKPIAAIVHADHRYELTVDGKPFFVLGAQIHNSSSWPVMLPHAMELAKELHANTIEAPVYWETLEQQPRVYDFANVDAVISQAREQHLRVVLLWFGSFKTCCSYTPDYIRGDTSRYPRVLTEAGDPTAELSPYYLANLNADKSAFAALLRHLKDTDSAQRTVIMVQVENEPGTLDTSRDHSAKANALFDGQVPGKVVAALHKSAGTWSQVFGNDADEAFSAWGIASYINTIAAAGKAEYPLPMYVNTWIGTPDSAMRPGFDCPSGGSTPNMLEIWKVAASSIDFEAPDIYLPNLDMYRDTLQQYHRPDNALYIPETIGFSTRGKEDTSRFLFYAMGQQALGYSPFGLDSLPTGAFSSSNLQLVGLATSYGLLGRMDQVLAAQLFSGKAQTAVQEFSHPRAVLDFGKWRAIANFSLRYPTAETAKEPELPGRILIAPLGPDEFLVSGMKVRVAFALAHPGPHEEGQYLRVEEGTYDGDQWKVDRWLNGDETFTGIQLQQTGGIVHVKLGTLR